MCLETLLLLEREAVEEGRGESLAAWGCVPAGEAAAGSEDKLCAAMWHGMGASDGLFSMGSLLGRMEGCGSRVGRSFGENGNVEIVL